VTDRLNVRFGSFASILACSRHLRLGWVISEMPVESSGLDVKLASIRIWLRANESATWNYPVLGRWPGAGIATIGGLALRPST
jgi:hypothetical protein